jgi:hypothetical protein
MDIDTIKAEVVKGRPTIDRILAGTAMFIGFAGLMVAAARMLEEPLLDGFLAGMFMPFACVGLGQAIANVVIRIRVGKLIARLASSADGESGARELLIAARPKVRLLLLCLLVSLVFFLVILVRRSGESGWPPYSVPLAMACLFFFGCFLPWFVHRLSLSALIVRIDFDAGRRAKLPWYNRLGTRLELNPVLSFDIARLWRRRPH